MNTEQKEMTIKEIAKLAGVSQTAVSLALNNKKGLSEKTKARIMAIVEEHNYIPNKSSVRLRKQKSYNVCLLMNKNASPFDDLFYMEIAKGILQRSDEYNYNVVISRIDKDRKELPDIIRQNDADGAIVFQNITGELLAKFSEKKFPLVFVDAYYSDENIVMVNTDVSKSCYVAINHLTENGHRDIGIICSDFFESYTKAAIEGCAAAFADNGITMNEEFINTRCNSEQEAYEYCEKLLKQKKRPTAIFGVGDIYAIGAMRAAVDLGLSVPKDVSFIGIDDIVLSKYIFPSLTTIGYDKIKMGSLAMELLINKIEGQQIKGVVVPSDMLIIRGSVAEL